MIAPSPFILQFLPRARPGESLLDLACGSGRHARVGLAAGYLVTAVDKTIDALGDLASRSDCEVIEADLEGSDWKGADWKGADWPLGARTFDVVIVTNYLWRPLMPFIDASVKPGGLVLYETFGMGNERFGKPSNPDYLLADGELEGVFAQGYQTLHAFHGLEGDPASAVRQRLAARKL